MVQQHDGKIITYRGAASTFRTPGRAGTTGQKLMSLHNATGSSIKVDVHNVVVDQWETVVKAVTVAPVIIRLWKVTVLPTNGTALTKVPLDSTLSSSGSLTVLGDASADGTGSGTTLTATLSAGTVLGQQIASRMITGEGWETEYQRVFEPVNKNRSLCTLNALEGVVVFLITQLPPKMPLRICGPLLLSGLSTRWPDGFHR